MLKISIKEKFKKNSIKINKLHFSQGVEEINNLNKKYLNPVIGRVEICNLIYKLAEVIDPTDTVLLNNSQLIHVFQVLDSMEKEKVKEEMIMLGVLHDIGKILVTIEEKPENIFCGNKVIGNSKFGCGLDNCMLQWNHDEFAYLKFKNYLTKEQLWLIRYHSIFINDVKPFMDKNDLNLCSELLIPFKYHDKHSKLNKKPEIDLEKYLKIVEKFIPKYIEI